MKLTAEDRVHVARAVWAEFVKLRGEGAPNPSSREYYVLSSWLDRQIPLAVILQAFGEFQGKPRVLGAMEVPVATEYARYRQAMALPGGEKEL